MQEEWRWLYAIFALGQAQFAIRADYESNASSNAQATPISSFQIGTMRRRDIINQFDWFEKSSAHRRVHAYEGKDSQLAGNPHDFEIRFEQIASRFIFAMVCPMAGAYVFNLIEGQPGK